MLKILQARVQQYVNCKRPDEFRKGRGTTDQIANIHWIIKRAREFQKNICFIDYTKAFDCENPNKLWKILQEIRVPDHQTCLLRNVYAGHVATVRTGHGTRTGKGQFSFQSQRKAMPKNAQTTAQLYSSHTLVK